MKQTLLHIRRALISVSDKSNILKLSYALSKHNIQILASEGTAKELLKSGLKVTTISQYTNFPEIMDGRLKTLHTKIYAGILARPKIDKNVMMQYSIESINMVIVNFYPYISSTIPKNKNNNIHYTNNINPIKNDPLIENIDIGGPSIVRAAAKNYKNVAVIVNNNDYKNIINELDNNDGKISIQTRLKLATKAFQYITAYDTLISNNFKKKLHKNKYYLQKQDYSNKKINIFLPDYTNFMNLNYVKKENMRYGENPHQSAAFYIKKENIKTDCISHAKQLQGKKLSYNNILDSDTALECVKTFIKPTCVIVKHGNPCGVATDTNLLCAYQKAYQTDPTSSFGSIIAFNKTLDNLTAQKIIEQQFTEVIIAPYINKDALKILNNKKNIRILIYGNITEKTNKKHILNLDFRQVTGGLLIQDQDTDEINKNNIEIVTQHQPTDKEIIDALFCWKVVRFVKSNAIVYGRNEQTIGIGSGQMSRIYAAKIAHLKAKNEKFNLEYATMASDAFLPFPDTVDIAASIGITCIIQPGGGIHDKKIINNADKNNISMIFTHVRHFRH